jgi:uncharacterized protein (TIGR03083 family)
MDPSRHLDALRTGSEALVLAAAGNLASPVPSCPDWDVSDLVVHVGLVWTWADKTVTTGERAEFGRSPEDGSEPALLEWARGHAAHLLATLGAADPDTGCWTFGLPRTRRFWFRRQALETALHAWDAQGAAGAPAPIDPDLAADGVDEFVSVLVPRWTGQHPGSWSGQSLHLHRTDGEGEWMVLLGADGAAMAERTHGKADVALRGPAEHLWLWCTNRVPLDALDLEVFGDRGVADRWSSEIAF